MDKTKKILRILSCIALVFLVMFLYFVMDRSFPNNMVSRIMRGIYYVLTPVVIALIVTYLINPFSEHLIRKRNFKKKTAVLVTLTLFVILVLAFLIVTGVFIYQQGSILYNEIIGGNLLASLKEWFEDHGMIGLYNAIYDMIQSFNPGSLLGSADNALGFISQLFITIVLVPIFIWYFLLSKDDLFLSFSKVFPDSWQPHIEYIGGESNKMIASYFKSKIVSMVYLFILFFVLFFLMFGNIGYAIFFASVITFLDLVPYLGPLIGMIVPVIYIFTRGGYHFIFLQGVWLNPWMGSAVMIGINLVLQQIQNSVIIPKLASKEMKINPLLILMSMLFFGSLLGLWGVLLSIPLGGVLMIVIRYAKNGFKPLPRKEEELS